MLKNLRACLERQREKRKKHTGRPWSKKQKIVCLAVLGSAVIYIIISAIIHGNEAGFQMPSLKLSISGLDVILLCVSGLAFAVFKLRTYVKSKKGK